jgi:predicted TIM-barrel fold metal-dependent hydrolase
MINGCLVTDMQHHFIPEAALQLLTKTPEHDFTSGLRRYPKAYSTMADIRTHLDYMDKAGIDVAVLSTGAFAPSGHEFCKACNEQYAAVVKQYPGRFKGMIQIYPLEDSSKNRDEVKRAVDLGLWGLSLASSYWQTTIDSPVMVPTFETALEYSMPVFIHPSVRINQWGGEKYNMYTTVSREYDVAKALVEMVFGVLPRFPGLKVIVAHLGGGFPALKGRLLTWHQPEGFPVPEQDRSQGLSVHRAKELGLVDDFERRFENVLFDAAGYGGWPPVMEAAFRALGADHLCYGTDYPYELNKAPHAKRFIEDIAGFDLPDEDKKKFFGENVERFMARS